MRKALWLAMFGVLIHSPRITWGLAGTWRREERIQVKEPLSQTTLERVPLASVTVPVRPLFLTVVLIWMVCMMFI